MTRVRARLSASWLAALATAAILTGVGTVQAQRAAPVLRNDKSVLTAFRGVVSKPSRSTVRILCDDKEAALGTVVAPDGWIITKASELKGKIVCKLKNGKSFTARLVGVEEKCDLAMLKIETSGLKPIEWIDSKSAVVGNWLASPGTGEDPVAVGVVSVATRMPARSARVPGYLGITLANGDGAPKIDKVEPTSAAARAGLKPGDVVLAVRGRKVPDAERLVGAIMGLEAGVVVKLKIKRGDEEKEVTATLGKRPTAARSRGDIQNAMGSKLSGRRAGFPVILQHDTVIKDTDCGGPVVGLDGKAVGINIARAGRTESYAIPSDKVRALLADLRSGKLAPKPQPVVNVENLKGSIKKLQTELALKQKAYKAAVSDDSKEKIKTLAEEIKALQKRLTDAEAALKKADKKK